MPDPNPPPDPGGSAIFDTDNDPTAVDIENFKITLTDEAEPVEDQNPCKITLHWDIENYTGGLSCQVEEREGLDGDWTSKGTLGAIAEDNTKEITTLGAGVYWCYRIKIFRGIYQAAVSPVLLYQVPLINRYISSDCGCHYKLTSYRAHKNTIFKWHEVCMPYSPDAVIEVEREWEVPISLDSESDEYDLKACLIGCPPKITLRGRMDDFLYENARYIPNEDKLEVGIEATNGSGSRAIFDIDPSGIDYSKYKLEWTGRNLSGFQVFSYESNPIDDPWNLQEVTNGQIFADEEIHGNPNFAEGWRFNFRVQTNTNAVDEDDIVLTLTTYLNDGTTVVGTDECKFYRSRPRSMAVPVDEASGAKYRKIGLNGRPLSDEKPQAAPEEDQQPEETFVDALTLGLRHSTTDAYVPVSGSELSLMIRRNSQSAVWSLRSGLRPHEQPDLPFGLNWNSNLSANIKMVSQLGENVSEPNYAYVTDENGATTRFVMLPQPGGEVAYFPFPTALHEQNTYLTSLEEEGDNLVFRRKFGSTLVYEPTTIDLIISKDRLAGSPNYEESLYYRLKTVTDRLGQVVEYEYETGEDDEPITTMLVPKYIRAKDRPDQTLYIRQNEYGLVTDIWDANWNRTQYGYRHNSVRNVWLMDTVTTADGAVTHYGYDENFPLEPDLALRPSGSTDPGTPYYHCDITSITDPNGKEYQFSYLFDHDGTNTGGQSLGKYNYQWSSENPETNGYYVTTGHARVLETIVLPDGLGETTFENYSFSKLVVDSEGHLQLSEESERRSAVVDAVGNSTEYRWDRSEARVYEVNTVGGFYNSDSINDPKIIFYLKLEIEHLDLPSAENQESYFFDADAGMNVARALDLSGNETRYEYGDSWTTGGADWYHTIIPTSNNINGRYEDPTKQRRYYAEEGRWLEKSFRYNDQRIMSGITDELGRRTEYDLDELGRRTAEWIYPSSSTTAVQATTFAYNDEDFPGFVSVKTVRYLEDSPPPWVVELIVAYEPDEAGRVQSETVNPGGLALVTTYEYDAQGSKTLVTDPLDRETAFAYDSRNRLVEVTYADETTRSYEYDLRGNKVRETDENGHDTEFGYDGLNRLITQTRVMDEVDASQNLITRFTYSAVGSKLTQADPNGRTSSFEYDPLQRLIKTIDALGQFSTFEYGENSGGSVFNVSAFKPTQSVNPRGYVTEVEYDSLYRPVLSRVQYQKSPLASLFAETSSEYDDVGNLLKVTDPLGKETSTTYDALNRPLLVTYADETTVAMAYSSTGLKYSVINERGYETLTEYDAAGRPVKVLAPAVTNPNTGLPERPVTESVYDAAGNVIKTINPLDNEWDFAYDARNRRITETQPEVLDAGDDMVKHPVIHTEYDGVGNVTKITDARGNATDTTYDRANRKIEVLAPEVLNPVTHALERPLTQLLYDRNGNVVRLTDPNGNATNNFYDALNRLIRTTDAENIAVRYTYDEVGNRLSVTDGRNNSTLFTYDGLNRNLTQTDPLGYLTAFAFDAVNKTSRTDAKEQLTTYTYDDRHRLKTVHYQGREQDNREYDYDESGNLLLVTEAENSLADVSYVYDALNRQTEETSCGKMHQYEYDLAGNRLEVIFGGTGRTMVSTYDALNRLSTLEEEGRITSYGYDLNGNILQLELPNEDVTSNSYDALNRCVEKETTNQDEVVISLYEQIYDLVGNVVEIEETYPSPAGHRIVANSYDDIYRLVEETITGATNRVTLYAYDGGNNRISKTVDSVATNYVHNAANQLIAVNGAKSAAYDYDANGNRWHQREAQPDTGDHLLAENGWSLFTENGRKLAVEAVSVTHYLTTERSRILLTEGDARIVAEGVPSAWGLATENGFGLLTEDGDAILGDGVTPGSVTELYEYDYENRLIKLTQGDQEYLYAYDYRTRRIFRNEGNGDEKIVFSGGTSCQEYLVSPETLTVEYIRGSDYGGGVGGILYTYRDNVPSFTHYDNRGDVTIKSDLNGAVTYQAQYEAFGKRTTETGSTQDRQKANTKDEDPTGLLNEGFRYRDLETGTFITRDPLGFVDGPNMYAYVVQNPWTMFDPTGLATLMVDNTVAKPTEEENNDYVKHAEQVVRDNFEQKNREVSEQFSARQEAARVQKAVWETYGEGAPESNPYRQSYESWKSLSGFEQNHELAKKLPFYGTGYHFGTAVWEGNPGEATLSAVIGAFEFLGIRGISSVTTRTFYSVQGSADVSRLAAGGAPWPMGLQRANMGEGLYTWGSKSEAASYAAGRPGTEILTFKMPRSKYLSLKTLDMRTMSDEAATQWLGKYSQYGEGLPHGFDHVIRGAGVADEYYFSTSAFKLFK